MKYNNIIISSAILIATAGLTLTSCSNDPELGDIAKEAIMADGISLNVDRDYSMAVGMTKQVEATITNIDEVTVKTIVWSSTDNNTVSVSQNGEIKALKAGKATINLTQEGSYSPSAYIEVTVKQNATALALSNTELYEGTTLAMTATLTPTDAYDVLEWTSADERIATVDDKGNITGVTPGVTTITAKTTDGTNITASAEVTVKKVVPIESITLTAPGYDLRPGESTTIECSLLPADASAQLLVWESSDNSTVSVDNNGKITAVKNGTATITATDPTSGNTESVTITVAYVASWNISDYASWNDLKDIGWSIGNGATAEIIDGVLHVETALQSNNNKYRGDIAMMNAQNKLTLDPETYPYLAIAMDPPGARGKRSIKLDFSGPNGSGDYGAEPTEFVTGKTQVACWNLLSKTKIPSGTLNTFQIKMADIAAEPYFYNIYWIHTFKTMDELKEFVNKYWN